MFELFYIEPIAFYYGDLACYMNQNKIKISQRFFFILILKYR